MLPSFFSRLFGLSSWRTQLRWCLHGLCCAPLLLWHSGVWAQDGALTAVPSPKPHDVKAEKPSAVVQKHYRCLGGKSLLVRYQLGTRSVHAFAKLQGKMRELPWDGDYKLEHEEDERFSDGQYEMLVQGDFSRIALVQRLAAKAGAKPYALYRACRLQTDNAQLRSRGANTRIIKELTPSLTPTAAPTPEGSAASFPVKESGSEGQHASP